MTETQRRRRKHEQEVEPAKGTQTLFKWRLCVVVGFISRLCRSRFLAPILVSQHQVEVP